MLTICVNPHVTESQGLKWGIHPVLSINLIPNILVDPPSKQPAKLKEHWAKSWMTAHGKGWGQLTGAASVLLYACFSGGHFPWSHTGSSYFLLEVLLFLLSLCFTSRSHHLYHTPRGREEESSGAGHKGQISIQGAFLSFSHSFRLHIALERLGIKWHWWIIGQLGNNHWAPWSVSPGSAYNAGLAGIVSQSPACAMELKNAWFY